MSQIEIDRERKEKKETWKKRRNEARRKKRVEEAEMKKELAKIESIKIMNREIARMHNQKYLSLVSKIEQNIEKPIMKVTQQLSLGWSIDLISRDYFFKIFIKNHLYTQRTENP